MIPDLVTNPPFAACSKTESERSSELARVLAFAARRFPHCD